MTYPNIAYIQPTQLDFVKGIRKSCTRCPIALATQRRFPNKHIEVDQRFITIYDKRIVIYSITTTLGKIITNYDSGFMPHSGIYRRHRLTLINKV